MRSAAHTDADVAAALAEHRAAMRRLAYVLVGPHDADDVVQDAAERAWAKRHTFDPARGSVRPWLLAIVADRARQRWRRPAPVWDELHPDALVVAGTGPVSADLGRAVARLAPRQRAAVVLHYYVDLPVTEVAALLECAEGTVKSTLHDARAALERTLGGSYVHD
ncbi:RNA polymerase sigma factor [Luteimicrobium sp. NPDC057192]|uniref:RNA polymerase sigma factor n=1 Tax=Luteimicrobium sp. NPDC057192 TaxID=3346042 RepID=UPI00363E0673